MSESEWTEILGWPEYRVYRSEINEESKKLRLRSRCGRGYRDMNYLLLKAQRLAPSKTEFLVLQKAA